MADRRQQIGGTEKIKEQLNQLKNIDRGPADKFAKALSRGDLKKAADELKKLKEALENGKLDAKQKAELAKQIEQMKNQLEKQAKAHQAAQQDLKKRIEQLRQAGQMQQANQLEEQLAKLAAQMPQMQKLQDLAEKLGQCSKCLRNGKPGDAAKALAQMQADLQGQLKEMAMLNEAEKELCQAKDQMGCCKCGGAGCEECQGPPGNGLGRGKRHRPQARKEDQHRLLRLEGEAEDRQRDRSRGRHDRRAERQRGRSAADSGAGRIDQARHDRSANRPPHAPQAWRARQGIFRRAAGKLGIANQQSAISNPSISRTLRGIVKE